MATSRFRKSSVPTPASTALDKPRIILGIDPGTQLLGFGVVRAVGKKAEYVDMGILDLRKEKDAYTKLQSIFDCISEVCKSYHPDELAIESPFYGKNAQVVLKLGRAQGAAIIANEANRLTRLSRILLVDIKKHNSPFLGPYSAVRRLAYA